MWLRAYVGLRALVTVGVCVLRLTGTLHQEPGILPWVACVVFLALMALLVRIDRWGEAMSMGSENASSAEASA